MPLSPSAQKVQDLLLARGFDCKVIEFVQSTRTAQEAADRAGCALGQITKSLIFKGQQSGKPVLVLTSGANRVDEKRISGYAGESIGRAEAEFVRAVTGFAIGGVPPLGLAQAMETYLDEDLLQYETIWAAAGTPNAIFELRPEDLQKMTGGRVASQTVKRIAPALLALTLGLLACARSQRAGSAPADPTRTLTSGGLQRSYVLHIPPAYDGSHPVPLVMDFHGGGGNAESQLRTSGFDSLADEKGFIVVYPNGTGRLGEALLTWNGGTCCGHAVAKDIDDVGFVRALVADLQSIANIDMKRIYATGLSNGGIFSYRLACDASDLIAAIGPVSGTQNISPCDPGWQVSVIDFHGTADEHLPYNGGAGDKSLAGVDFVSVKDSIDFWVKFDQCPASPQTESFADIQHDTYSNCLNGSAVELYTVVGGKHAWPGGDGPAWPGGDPPTQSISATQLIWDFFSAHPKP